MIRIVDYGVGNIQAFHTMYRRLNFEVAIARSATDLQDATKLILPGVGHFDRAMALLNRSGLREPLEELVLTQRVPVLGVCVGMQMLARSSSEGSELGLGWIEGEVRGFDEREDPALLLPHMGWNDVHPAAGEALFAGLETDARFYFLHSFYFDCAHEADVAASSTYGGDFTCAVRRGNVHGVQFHPEKSHHFGTRLLKNFADL